MFCGPIWMVPERPGCSQSGPPGTICSACIGAPAAASTASASPLASSASAVVEPDQCRPIPFDDAKPRRTPAAAMNWSSGRSPLKICPTSNSATSAKPRSPLACTEATRPGSRLGRMSVRSAAIGLASTSSLLPPPNNSAACLVMNEYVTASIMPRAASARLARRVRCWIGVSTALRAPRRGRTASSAPCRRRRCARSPRRCRPCPARRCARTGSRPSRPAHCRP